MVHWVVRSVPPGGLIEPFLVTADVTKAMVCGIRSLRWFT